MAWHRMRTGASKGALRESDMLLLKHEVAEIWIKKIILESHMPKRTEEQMQGTTGKKLFLG